MKFYIILLNIYFKITSFISPSLAASQAFGLFQRTRKKSYLSHNDDFYAKARSFKVPFYNENLHVYELGDPQGKLVILIHGWDSHAGRFSAIADLLVKKHYHVIALNLPGHGPSSKNRSNLKLGSDGFAELLQYLNPRKPFSIITHSFGSAVSAFALSGTKYEIDNYIMVTTPERLMDFFEEFRDTIGLGRRAFFHMMNTTDNLLGEKLNDVRISKLVSNINYRCLTLIHDPKDKILPIENSETVVNSNKSTSLRSIENAGHTRILWNSETLQIIDELSDEKFQDDNNELKKLSA